MKTAFVLEDNEKSALGKLLKLCHNNDNIYFSRSNTRIYRKLYNLFKVHPEYDCVIVFFDLCPNNPVLVEKLVELSHNLLLPECSDWADKVHIIPILCSEYVFLQSQVSYGSAKELDLSYNFGVVKQFCTVNKFSYRTAKDTATVKRYMIHYGGSKPVKVEISYRNKTIDAQSYGVINGFIVYTIESLLIFKIGAYLNRDKIRDLFDVTFICTNYWNSLSSLSKWQVKAALSQKGLEHFDYIMQTQADDLIDKNYLGDLFLNLYNNLGLL